MKYLIIYPIGFLVGTVIAGPIMGLVVVFVIGLLISIPKEVI